MHNIKSSVSSYFILFTITYNHITNRQLAFTKIMWAKLYTETPVSLTPTLWRLVTLMEGQSIYILYGVITGRIPCHSDACLFRRRWFGGGVLDAIHSDVNIFSSRLFTWSGRCLTQLLYHQLSVHLKLPWMDHVQSTTKVHRFIILLHTK